jgi:signal transduction histidine kinase/phage shock protein PspC (stress-responsive transcriptional regulator)
VTPRPGGQETAPPEAPRDPPPYPAPPYSAPPYSAPPYPAPPYPVQRFQEPHRRGRRGWQGHRGRGCWQRSLDDRLLGGVAGGISKRLHVDPTLVRIAFAVTTVFGGFGAACYLGAWLMMPLEGHDESIGARVAKDRQGIVLALAFIPALVVMFVVGSALHIGVISSAAWPLFLCAAAAVLLWRNVDVEEREWLREAAAPVIRLGGGTKATRRDFVLRILIGAVLVGAGVVSLTFHHGHVGVFRVVAGVALFLAGAVVLFGPWWLHLVRDLLAERQARVRAEERADVASRVHDSVLQTLALIQRAADDPHRVVALARGQERELRAWLFDGEMPGALGAEVTTLAAGCRAIAAEVEASHGVVVDVVVVGDCPLDDRLRPLLDAAREATVNAAKWSGAPSISLFAEVEPGKVSVYVRDRGRGFDPDQVAPDRQGIAQSIQARMLRYGGRAVIRSAPGDGTEVELTALRGEAR